MSEIQKTTPAGASSAVVGINPRITAQIRYSIDTGIPGEWHLRVIRSSVPAGKVTGFQTALLDDDVTFITPDDLDDLSGFGCQIADQTVLTREPKFVGDPIALVVAPTARDARVAAALVEVSYEEHAPVFDHLDAIAADAPLVHARHHTSESDSAYFDMRPQDGTNVCHRFRIRTPQLQGRAEPDLVRTLDDADEALADAFADAEVIVDEVFHTPAAAHVPMEPHATSAQWTDGRLEVITGTQTPFNIRQDLATIFGLPAEDVRVVAPPMGGAFGAKTFIRTEALTAAAAKVVGHPVRCVLDRDEVFNEVTRHPATVRVKLGAKRDGTFVAKRMWNYVNTGGYADCGPGVAQKMGYAGVGPYRFDHVAVDSYCIYTNLPPGGAYRGFGAMQSVWASERAVDLLAERLGMDPVELRRRNLLREGDTFCTGEVMHDVHFEDLLDDAAQAVGWSTDGDRTGKGVAIMLKGMQTPSKAEARIELLPDGRYEVQAATADIGQGASEMLTRLAAESLKCDVDQIVVCTPDTDRVPYDTRTTSSRSTHMMSRALADAARDLLVHGRIGHGYAENEGGLDPDTGQGIASSHWHQGSAAADLDVDPETGVISLKTLFASSYAGKVVNPHGAELQQEGSMILALGSALFEELQFANGQMTNPNLSDYNIASALDVASLRHRVMEIPGAEVHGLGETAVPPVPPAIGNAVASLGYDVRRLPMTPERVLDATTSEEESWT
ncbi:xanthine dehydrogenase family protein molybdopterin-binding subunit [Nocardioides kongjuensis]|uniref:CO/xanthine dehydrogenase Mo-binding subunit n=1 Tax=Nocardioides kongjuensis TaxID=349522 RepID=A0A852RDL8_9ACTN|nr:xanthine dehydrogenase family protein molybdopterin-binding subunit [Nocardioides kongjuensis]NYD29335.1 CO/xanthine dehydrogenase Mo-binding subunit [Nocardioides kongjuensis]